MMLPFSCCPFLVRSRNPGREGLIVDRTFRAGLDKLLPVAFCGTQLTKKGLRRGAREIPVGFLIAGFRVKLGANWYQLMRLKKTPLYPQFLVRRSATHVMGSDPLGRGK
jgi:hypothetical protein